MYRRRADHVKRHIWHVMYRGRVSGVQTWARRISARMSLLVHLLEHAMAALTIQHKKRGRPKVNKAPIGTPYQRARPPHDDMMQYRQAIPPSYPNLPPGNYDPMYHPQQDYKPFYQNAPPPPQARIPSPQTAGSDPPNLFTLFTTTDFRIMRVSQGSWGLTGYHQPDFMGHSLLDWVMPVDRGLLEEDRTRLLTLPNSTMVPDSKYELLQNTIHHRSERELVSPAEGMGEYPNQNVRIVRSDQQYNLFNVRLHVGGGLGGSLYHPDTYDRLYLVVSCLLIPPPPGPPQGPHSRAVSAGTMSSYGPPTPITPMTAGPPGGLPGFSQIAAGVEAPPSAIGQRYPSGTYSPYFPSRPTSQHQQAPISTPGVTVAYHRATSTPQPQILPTYPAGQIPPATMYAKSPSQELQTPSYAPYEYPPQQQPQQNEQAYYPDYRDDQWNRHSFDGVPPPLQQLPAPPQTASSSSSNPPPPNDYSRRPWES
jgi:hypothetical protein